MGDASETAFERTGTDGDGTVTDKNAIFTVKKCYNIFSEIFLFNIKTE